MFEQNDAARPHTGLFGIIKIALIICVLLVASLAILLATDVLSSESFYTYLKTLLILMGIGTLSSLVIAMLSSPNKQ